jgi:hypothetical protein
MIMNKLLKLANYCMLLCILGSCSNNLDEIYEQQEVKSRSVEPRFNPINLSLSQSEALINRFLDSPDFFYLDDVIGIDPTVAVVSGSFTVYRDTRRIKVRAIQIGVVGKRGRYGVYSSGPNSVEDIMSVNNPPVLLSEPIYDESNPLAILPVGKRYIYGTNGVGGSDACWVCIDWEDIENYEYFIYQDNEGYNLLKR